MKICSKCGTGKTSDQFNKSSRNKDGLHAYCRQCQSDNYQSNKTTHRKRVKDRNKRVTSELRAIALKYLLTGCVDCEEHDIVVLDFDHTDPKMKSSNISVLLRRAGSEQKFIEEIEKCQVRCANCHRKRTEKQRPSWRTNALVSALASNESKP